VTGSAVTLLRSSALILAAAASPAFAASGPSPPPSRADGVAVSTLSGGLVDDVPDSLIPNSTPAAGCGKVPAKIAPSLRPMNIEMVIVNTWRRPSGDIEGISKVTPTDDGGARLSNSGQEFASDADTLGRPSTHNRTLCAADLADSHTFVTLLGDGFPELLPGATQFSLSTATLHLLRTTGEAPLDYVQYEFVSPPDKWIPVPFSGTLRRVESTDVQYPMIIDGASVTVAALHAKGVFEFSGFEPLREQIPPDRVKQQAEFYVLDDESKPLSLLFKFGPVFQVQVVSIAYPQKTPQNTIEHQLLAEKHAVVYGIYFDFNSDHVRAESQPVLRQIADALAHNPGWKLTIDGYTDNIGGDPKNLDLSRRRAEAVRRALVGQFHLPNDRMMTNGYGASRPVDSNDTLAGRARNRRVELTRE
jgi:outer membrane protein OmpA-like peptidoglycan-associated protein